MELEDGWASDLIRADWRRETYIFHARNRIAITLSFFPLPTYCKYHNKRAVVTKGALMYVDVSPLPNTWLES